MTVPVLKITGLSLETRSARPKAILKGVDIEIKSGETVCIVGESGSGKSVTSLAVMGLLARDSLARPTGSILLEGGELIDASEHRLRQLRASRMAMVFQEPMTALNPVHSVGRQIDEVLRLHTDMNRVERRERVLAMLRDVHLPDVERIYHSYPHQLSGGQRQRIVISMALVLKPALLICDEPTTALDVTTQKQILNLIRELQVKHKTAVMFITHDFGVVAEIADRIVVMNHGSIVEQGERQTILERPGQPYTRMLVSSVPSLVPHVRPEPVTKTVLEVKALAKTYHVETSFFGGNNRVVSAATDVNLVVRQGEILGIVGESGSGKSTVARCIVRLVDPTSGSVQIDGQEIAGTAASALRKMRKDIQIVFQDPYRSLNPRRRVGESILEGLINFGVPRIEALKRARELLELVRIDSDAMQRYPHQFSGGQRQRICIARALALEPRLLVADEAVSALDVSVQAQILALLEEIRRKTNIGVLFITHDLRVAAQICDTVIVMQKGRIVEAGPVGRVLAAPREAYTRALIDAAPGRHWDFQNFRPASVKAAGLETVTE
ncbi:MAG TPA: ABC transporter ATP-binding protein [Rhizobiaceae bacterium]|nr:ABC transporter ATP-binding protein [Rhizobiaceae bacterium]